MAVIGITGGIASGKSTFRGLLAPLLPAEVLDADLLARQILEHDPEVREMVCREVTPAAFLQDGTADRDAIRRVIYSDPAAKQRLEGILHPRVRNTWLASAAAARQSGHHLLIDIPLLFETKAEKHFDQILVVACSPDVQLSRLRERGLDPATSAAIIASQMPASEKIARATHVVWNDGGLPALVAQAEEFAGRLRQAEIAPAR